jgi:hypothetical protein
MIVIDKFCEIEQAPPKERIYKLVLGLNEDSLYSYKAHYNAAAYWSKINTYVGVPSAILAALSGVLSVNGGNVLAAILAFTSAALIGLNTFLNPSERSQSHFSSGTNFHDIYKRTKKFVNIDLIDEDNVELLVEKLDGFINELSNLNAMARPIPASAYSAAKKGIENEEHIPEVDKQKKEI